MQPFELDAATLQPFIERAFKEQDIEEAVKNAEADFEYTPAKLERYLRSELAARAEKIKAAAEQKAVLLYNLEAGEYTRDVTRLEEGVWPGRKAVEKLEKVGSGGLMVAFFAGVGLVIAVVKAGAQETYSFLLRYPVLLGAAGFVVAAAVGARALYLAAKFTREARVAKQTAGLGKKREKIEGEIKAAVDAGALEAVVDECREILSDLRDSYSTVLKVKEAPGLAEVSVGTYAIDTEAKEQLELMLDKMPGGSIGIAGPRGAGKTTLMRKYCEGPVADLGGSRVLNLMTSAPVGYDPRDFILYLFQEFCEAERRRAWSGRGRAARASSCAARPRLLFAVL